MVGLNGFYPTMAQYGGLDARDLFPPYKAMSDHTCQIVNHLSALNEVLFYAELELRELLTLSGHASLTSLAEEGLCKAHEIGDDVQTSGHRRSETIFNRGLDPCFEAGELLYESERSEQQCYYELSIILPDCSSSSTMEVGRVAMELQNGHCVLGSPEGKVRDQGAVDMWFCDM
ncbi:hypothetical protein MRX96_025853 [Rhipicephalus microplus]